jgi:hypothetical protein
MKKINEFLINNLWGLIIANITVILALFLYFQSDVDNSCVKKKEEYNLGKYLSDLDKERGLLNERKSIKRRKYKRKKNEDERYDRFVFDEYKKYDSK